MGMMVEGLGEDDFAPISLREYGGSHILFCGVTLPIQGQALLYGPLCPPMVPGICKSSD
jgi:hypothetical protein